MKNNIFILGLLAVALGFNACKEDDAEPVTSIEVTVEKDTIINGVTSTMTVPNATVVFYSSKGNWKGAIDPLGLGTRFVTNAQGKARINGLTGGYTYHWSVRTAGCNQVDTLTNSMTLAGGTNNTATTKIAAQDMGVIKIINVSKYPYRIFIDGLQWFDIPGSTTISHFKPAGLTYTVRAEQLEGPGTLRNLTFTTISGSLACNTTKTGTITWQ